MFVHRDNFYYRHHSRPILTLLPVINYMHYMKLIEIDSDRDRNSDPNLLVEWNGRPRIFPGLFNFETREAIVLHGATAFTATSSVLCALLPNFCFVTHPSSLVFHEPGLWTLATLKLMRHGGFLDP